MELILELIYSVTVKVLYVSPKIICFMKGLSILMSSTMMFVMSSHKRKLKVCKISTHDNPADMMTKPVHVAKFELCSSLVGLTA